MFSISGLRTQVKRAQIEISKLCAAPDRRRRRRWAKDWTAEHAAARGWAESSQSLAREGFSACTLPDATMQELLHDWKALRATRENATSAPSHKSSGKVFFEELLANGDLQSYPAFLRVALDEGVLQSVVEAMGMVPHLESIDILASVHRERALSASQLWHYDVNDARIIKLFVYLEDCWERNGPFTFIPATISRRISGAVGHYVDDAHIARYVPKSTWQSVEGRAGTAFLIDTGRCYHFGSRGTQTRYAFVATYSSGLKFMPRATLWRDLLSTHDRRLSPLQSVACGVEE